MAPGWPPYPCHPIGLPWPFPGSCSPTHSRAKWPCCFKRRTCECLCRTPPPIVVIRYGFDIHGVRTRLFQRDAVREEALGLVLEPSKGGAHIGAPRRGCPWEHLYKRRGDDQLLPVIPLEGVHPYLPLLALPNDDPREVHHRCGRCGWVPALTPLTTIQASRFTTCTSMLHR